jgi:hypothetical protein
MEDRQPSIVHRLSSIFNPLILTPLILTLHSHLSAIIGSTFVDLRAGM